MKAPSVEPHRLQRALWREGRWLVAGDIGHGVRRIIPIIGGEVRGEINGKVLPFGADFQIIREWEKTTETGDRAEIKAQRRPAVLALDVEALGERQGGGRPVRLPSVGTDHGNECIGLLGSGGVDPAAAVVFETAADDLHAVGEQGGCKRVAAPADVRDTVEAKVDGVA